MLASIPAVGSHRFRLLVQRAILRDQIKLVVEDYSYSWLSLLNLHLSHHQCWRRASRCLVGSISAWRSRECQICYQEYKLRIQRRRRWPRGTGIPCLFCLGLSLRFSSYKVDSCLGFACRGLSNLALYPDRAWLSPYSLHWSSLSRSPPDSYPWPTRSGCTCLPWTWHRPCSLSFRGFNGYRRTPPVNPTRRQVDRNGQAKLHR